MEARLCNHGKYALIIIEIVKIFEAQRERERVQVEKNEDSRNKSKILGFTILHCLN